MNIDEAKQFRAEQKQAITGKQKDMSNIDAINWLKENGYPGRLPSMPIDFLALILERFAEQLKAEQKKSLINGMKNIPEKIYLQIGFEPDGCDDFTKLHDVSWCVDKVFPSDIEYTLKASAYTPATPSAV